MSPRPRPFVPNLNAAEEGTLKGQLIKLGMYTIAASFEAEAERVAKDETPVCGLPGAADRVGDDRQS